MTTTSVLANSRVSCLVTLIHNHQPLRNNYAIPHLLELCRELQADFEQVGWQPPVEPHPWHLALTRELYYMQLELHWARYRQMPRAMGLRIFRHYLFNQLPKYVVGGRKLRDHRRRSFIESAVTAKHVLAWRLFLESDQDYLICCEDDVVFLPESTARLQDLRDSDLKELEGELVYADLAGGLAEDALQIQHLIQSKTADRVRYRQPVTNTACCYVLSRRLATSFMTELSIRPWLHLMGIDWMMNALFMRLAATEESCHCIHFRPTIFGHGTFTGEYQSWQHAKAHN